MFRKKFGWTVPWTIEQDSDGNYYVSDNPSHYHSSGGGTVTVFVERMKKEIIVRIHPNEVECIYPGSDGLVATLIIDDSMPDRKSRAIEQTMDTIAFVDKYSPALADYMIKKNLDKFD